MTSGTLALDQVSIDPILVTGDGHYVHLGDVWSQCSWSELPNALGQALSLVVPEIGTPAGSLQALLAPGARLQLHVDYGAGDVTLGTFTLFRRWYRDDGHQSIEIQAYDDCVWLTRSDATYMQTGTSGTGRFPKPTNQCIRELLALPVVQHDFSIAGTQIGAISGPTAPLYQRAFVSQKIADIILQMLRWAWRRTPPDDPQKQPYFLQLRNGVLDTVQAGANAVLWVLEEQQALALLEEEQDITNLVTEVGIVSLYQFAPESDQPPAANAFPSGSIKTVPDPTNNYAGLVTGITAGQGTDPAYIVADIQDLQQQADVQAVQRLGFHIRREIQVSDQNGPLALAQAYDILNVQGRPWRTYRYTTPLLPNLRRGDAIIVLAGTVNSSAGPIGALIVTGVEHDGTQMLSHITVDSQGILGQRTSKQHYIGAMADESDTISLALLQRQKAQQTDQAPRDAPVLPSATGSGQDWVQIARSALGSPYAFGGAGGRSSFAQPLVPTDCSGYVAWVYKNAFGVTLPAQTQALYAQTTTINPANPSAPAGVPPGALVFYNMGSNDPHLQHVALYLGNGQVIQDGGSTNAVNIADVNQAIGSAPLFRIVPGLNLPAASGS